MITDYEGIDQITSPPGVNYSYSVEAGIGAGIDMVWSVNFLHDKNCGMHHSLHFSVGVNTQQWS